MIEATVLLLTYYFEPADRNKPVLRHVINTYCPTYLPFDIYLREPLQKIFSKVVVYDFLERRKKIGLKAMNQEILEYVRNEKPKYVIWTSFYDDVQQLTLASIREAGTKTIGWFFDDDWRFDSYSKYWIPYLDYCVTNSPSAESKYESFGARVIQTVPNTGIALDVDWQDSQEEYDVSFVGSSKFANREQFIHAIRKREIHIDVFGEGSSGYVSYKRMLQIFRTSKINLNFSVGGSFGDRQIKGRIFQVCMAGGFLLTENTPGINKYFVIDKEIVCFEDPKEMLEKIEYYLAHEDERRAIANAGWEKASREYSSSAMIAKVFDEVEKNSAIKTEKSGNVVTNLQLPFWARRQTTRYHLEWAVACLRDNGEENLLKEALTLSLHYNRFNPWTWGFVFAGVCPVALRKYFISIYRLQQQIVANLFRLMQSLAVLKVIREPSYKKVKVSKI